MSTAQIQSVGQGRTRTAPANPPDGFPLGFPRYRNYTVFAFTSLALALAALILLFGVAALGRGEDAWQGYLAILSSAPMLLLSAILLGFSLYFALRFGWVGRKIAAGRIGPIPAPPVPLLFLGAAPIAGFVVLWLLILALLGGALG
ncbi:MAG: hypothetical protein GY725_23370 [bacterium]|nr:hypothetical protein [bacterium]